MNLFKKIVLFFKGTAAKLNDSLKANSKAAVEVTNALKSVVESPVTTMVVNIIPGDLDNRILDRLRAIVPIIAAEMAIAHGILQQAKSNSEVVAAIILHVQAKHPDGRAGFWIEFAGRINYALADGKVSFAEAVALAQLVYAEIKSGK